MKSSLTNASYGKQRQKQPLSFHWSFAWQSLTGRSIINNNHAANAGTINNNNNTNDDWSAKEEEILQCLAGNDDQAVNLWHLRELALSPGGLVSPFIRIRAWPKLVACHEHMMMNKHQEDKSSSVAGNTNSSSTSTTTPKLRPLSRSQDQALQTDLRTTVWDVEGELRRRKAERKREQAAIDALLEQERLRNKRVKFAPTIVTIVNGHSNHDHGVETKSSSLDRICEAAPAAMRASPTHSEEETDFENTFTTTTNNEEASITEQSTIGTLSPCTVASQETSFVSLLSTSSMASSRAVQGRKTTIHEKRVLYTLITNLLRSSPAQDENNNNKGEEQLPPARTYHPGFQDLVALLLYNLESATITSIVLRQLASHHWKPLLSSKSQLEEFLSASFMPLLDRVDNRLAQHLQDQGMKLPTFCRSWVASWFASDMAEAAAASRMLDVLLVSHPFMVVYLSVAWVTQQRRKLLGLTDFVALAKALRRLPYEATKDASDLSQVEQVIALALSYMKKIPPNRLFEIVQNLQAIGAPSHALDISVPLWFEADVAPNDWAVLAKQMPVSNIVIDRSAYPLASAATGQSTKQKNMRSTSHRKLIGLLFLVAAAVVVTTSWQRGWPFGSQVAVPVMQHLPSTKRRRASRKPLPALTFAPYASMRTTSVSDGAQDEIDFLAEPSSFSRALVMFVGGGGNGGAAAGEYVRLPWWRRVHQLFLKLFSKPRWLEWLEHA